MFCDEKDCFSLQFFSQQCNKALAALAMERKDELLSQSVSQRIRLLLRWRLEMIIPFIGA
jgi:hypothetical protein